MHHPVINCPKCQGLMEEGFVLDRGHYDTRRVNTWVEGEPVKSFWSGIKVKNKLQFEVKTFRCGGCGYNESYAVQESGNDSSIFA